MQGLSMNSNLFLEIFLELHKCQLKTRNFQGKFHKIFQCLRLMKAKYYSSLLRNNFNDIEKDIRSYKKLWKVV